jgi:hypothetical protein
VHSPANYHRPQRFNQEKAYLEAATPEQENTSSFYRVPKGFAHTNHHLEVEEVDAE